VSTVLVVEDDRLLRRALRATFAASDFDVLEAASGEEAMTLVANARPDAVVLDLGLPGMDGLETLRHVRGFSDAPVVVLTVRDRLADKVAALDSGADDYVLKPFEADELLARVRAHLRRPANGGGGRTTFRAGELEIDLVLRRVTWAGESVALTPIEYRVMEVLVANRGRLMTRDELFSLVWGSRAPADRGRMRALVVHLRRKLHDDAAQPQLIFTEPGLGYRWALGEDDSNASA
jgi:two-component system KDP operon response regulator KdpE